MDRILETKQDVEAFIAWLRKQPLPLRASATRGAIRSLAQNALQGLWIKEIAKQWHEPPEDVRAFLKLTIGIPLLREKREGLRERYDSLLKQMPYEKKLAIMQWPLPVTSLMSVEDMTEYLNRVQKWACEQGFQLTDPELLEDPAVKIALKEFPSATIERVSDAKPQD